jgi:ribosomal protein L15E
VYKYYEVILVDPSHKAVSIAIIFILHIPWLMRSRFAETPELTGLLSLYTSDGKLAASRALENRYVTNTSYRYVWSHSHDLPQNRGIGKGHRYNNTPRVATWKRHNTLSLRRYR